MGKALTDFYAYLSIKRPLKGLPSFMGESGAADGKDIVGLTFCTAFLISHELSHISEGHLNSLVIKKSCQADGNMIDIFQVKREFELQADRKGAELLYSVPSDMLRDAAPFLVSTILGALDHLTLLCEGIVVKQAESLMRKADFENVDHFVDERQAKSSYPLGEARFTSLMDTFGKKISKTGLDFALFFQQFVFKSLWELDDNALGTISDCAKELINLRVMPSFGFLSHFEQLASEYAEHIKISRS
jgi:hypothetical protein